MAKVLKYSEWQSPTGFYYCNDTSNLGGIAGEWWVPSRMLGMSPAEYVEWLVTTYKPDKISFNGKTLIYSWAKENYGLCHKFVLYINAQARKRNFLVW
jgi:hypothetical protein